MKKLIAILLATMVLLTACGGGDGPSPEIPPHLHYDNDHDGICDKCPEPVECPHTSEDNDGVCDYCGKPLSGPCTVHSDGDGDGKCDSCGVDVEVVCKSHKDLDGDNKCDACGADTSIECSAHTDGDKNGKCDTCSVSVVIILDFYAVNDTHGKFANSNYFTGVDELTTYLKNAYSTDDNTVILSSGDMWQGAFESNLTSGFIITEWMNELDFVSMTLGNHEFDWGSEFIAENGEIAEFPMLAINVYDRATNERADFCQPSVMVERDGIKIGVIGAIGDCYSSISASMVTDVRFKVGAELTALVKAESDRLRAEGADLIVYSLHDGYGDSSSEILDMGYSDMIEYYDTSLSNGYVDLVFEGHSHRSYIHRDNYGVYHLQTGGDDSGVAHVELALNYVTDEYSVSIVDIVDSYEYQSLADDPIVDTLLEKYKEPLAPGYEYLGTNNSYRSSNYVCDLVAKLYYEAAIEKWGSEYDIALGGAYLQLRSPYCLAAGNVIYGDLLNILPFNNDVVLCSISGAKLLDKFFNTTNSSYHIYYGVYGASIRDNIDRNATYYIVTDTYTSDYSSNGLTVIDRFADGVYARDLVADYIMDGGFGTGVNTKPDSSYEITPLSTILNMLDGMDYNVNTPEFYVKGTIVSFDASDNAQIYGNCTIRDENGDEMYVYGIWSSDGGKFETLATKPEVGDTVILYGHAKYYRYNETSTPKKELEKMTFIEIVEE